MTAPTTPSASETDAEVDGFETALDWWAIGEPDPIPTCPYTDPQLAAAWDRGFIEGHSK